MKKAKMIAALAAVMCSITSVSAPMPAFAGEAETENRDQVTEQALVLPEDIAYIRDTLRTFLWDRETNTRTMDAYTELDENRNIIIVADNEEILAAVRAFVTENALDESLIGYRIERFADMIPDGETAETPVTNAELETLVSTLQTLNTFLTEKGFTDNSAFASLYWGRHAIECYAQSYAVEHEIRQFMKENDLDENLITVTVAPEADYREPTGGQRSYEEVNTVVAGEYITLKQYLHECGMLSNIYLTTKYSAALPDVPYSCVEISVRSQDDADALQAYLEEAHYWQDVVEITVQPDLSADPDSTIRSKDYICLAGDSNDDGAFAISDVIKLQKCLLATDTMTARQGYASDLSGNGCVDAADLAMQKRHLIEGE